MIRKRDEAPKWKAIEIPAGHPQLRHLNGLVLQRLDLAHGFAENPPLVLPREKIYQLLQKRRGRRVNGITGKSAAEILIRNIFGIGFRFADGEKYIAQQNRVGGETLQKLAANSLGQIHLDQGSHTFERVNVQADRPGASGIVIKASRQKAILGIYASRGARLWQHATSMFKDCFTVPTPPISSAGVEDSPAGLVP